MLIVEKIEGNIVTVEDEDIHFNIDMAEVNGNIKEGDVLVKDGDVYISDKAAAELRRDAVAKLQDSLFE